MRNISFALTTPQFEARTKTVTRRWGWKFLKPGDRLMGCRKCMGFKKGEKIERLHAIEIISVCREQLCDITGEDCIKEGFPSFKHDPFLFVLMMTSDGKHKPTDIITRIEFKHLEAE